MRNFINLFESMVTNADHAIGLLVQQGQREGHTPVYWKLRASEEVLGNDHLMRLIGEMIAAGKHEDIDPDWHLVVKADDAAAAPEGEIEESDEPLSEIPGLNPPEITSAETPTPDSSDMEMSDQLDTIADEIEALTHKVVAVHQKFAHEGDEDWYEVPDHEASAFVVEDPEGNPVDWHDERNAAEAHAHSLNNPVVMDEDDIPEEDMAPAPTMFANSGDWVAHLHILGGEHHEQADALEELRRRNPGKTPHEFLPSPAHINAVSHLI